MTASNTSDRRQSMTSPIHLLIVTGTTILSLLTASAVAAEDEFGYATEAEALSKAQELGCEGAYEWEGIWLPCEEDNIGSDDHSGHDHSHGHQH
ncbi:hypothetical protein SynA1825c_01861 [Synechococcus sp. A18-25c]|nr:hypothetical protein SynA1825c_01861 [Synechococcus sp. A18-25c]